METLACNSCGAPLNVPEGAKYVKCNHCGQQLAIKRSETVSFTEAVDKLTETTESLTEKIDELSRQNELSELARKWEHDRQRFMISDKNGNRELPSKEMSIFSGIAVTAFGLVWLVVAIGITSSMPGFGAFNIAKLAMPAFGVLFIVTGIVNSMKSYNSANDYKHALRRYEQDRSRILNK